MELLESFNIGMIYALLGVAFYMCVYKLKFINLLIGPCFYYSGAIARSLYDAPPKTNTISYCVFILLLISALLGIINGLFLKMGIKKVFSNIITLLLSSAFFPMVESSILKLYNVHIGPGPKTLPFYIAFKLPFFWLLVISVSSFFIAKILIKKRSSILNDTLLISFSNILSSLASILHFPFEIEKYLYSGDMVFKPSYTFSIVVALLIFLITKLFTKNCKGLSISLFITFMSSILLSQITVISKMYNITDSYLRLYTTLLLVFIVYLIRTNKSALDITASNHDSSNDICQIQSKLDNENINIKNEDFINLVKSQYI
ncbi:MAG: hypothetical protein ACOX3T_06920 [Bdellovibrionota bacterium]